MESVPEARYCYCLFNSTDLLAEKDNTAREKSDTNFAFAHRQTALDLAEIAPYADQGFVIDNDIVYSNIMDFCGWFVAMRGRKVAVGSISVSYDKRNDEFVARYEKAP